LNLQGLGNNTSTRDLGITGALKFENCHFTVIAAKENKRVHVRFFFCDPLEDKIVYRVSQNERIPSRGSCREKSQESRKNKIKNVGGRGSLQKYMSLKVQTFHHVFFQ
jgi:hypothetical protein